MLNEALLRQFLPFNDFNDTLIAEALTVVRVAKAKKGTMLFKRGKELADKFFLLEGELRLINNEYGSEQVTAGDTRARQMLNHGDQSRVSAIAKTPVTYLTINAELLTNLVEGRPAQPVATPEMASEQMGGEIEVAELSEQNDWMSCLLKSPLFSRIQSAQLQELFTRFETQIVAAGDMLVKEGAQGDFFYVLASGQAQVLDRSGAIDLSLEQGQYFGEEALISSAPRNASVIMKTDGVVKRLNSEDFASLVKAPVLQYLAPKALASIDKPYKLLDVRLPIEYRTDPVPGSINVPLSRLRNSLRELAQSNTYVVSDQGGGRADIAAYLLCQAGFEAFVLKGGRS